MALIKFREGEEKENKALGVLLKMLHSLPAGVSSGYQFTIRDSLLYKVVVWLHKTKPPLLTWFAYKEKHLNMKFNVLAHGVILGLIYSPGNL